MYFELERMADFEQISLNQLINLAIAEKLVRSERIPSESQSLESHIGGGDSRRARTGGVEIISS